jgi:probable rRNA maturation factor
MPTRRTANASTNRKAEPTLVFTLQIACNAAGIPSRHRLRGWAKAALRRDARLTVRLVGAREGRSLNKRYRGRDYATNVLTFVYDDRNTLHGDIALCAPVIAKEARDQGKTAESHYAHLMVHGVLHLQGFDHEAPKQAAGMEAREIRILRALGFEDPYQTPPRTTAT